MISVYFNGLLMQSKDFDGLRNFSVSGQVSNGVITREISSEFKVRGAAYEYIRATFIDNTDGVITHLPVKFVDDCCGYVWEGIMTFEGIRWCEGECFCTCKVAEDDAQLTCFKSTAIADDWNGFQQRTDFPKMAYCNEMRPNWVHEVILILVIIMNIVFDVLAIVIAPISLMIQAFCWLLGVFDDIYEFFGGDVDDIPDCPPELADGILDDYFQWLGNLNQQILGCGRRHPSPLLRDYIKNVCDKCGLAFQSTILNDSNSPYYNTVYMNPEAKKGCYTCNWIPDNEPLLLGDELMNELNTLFNGAYIIKNNVLIFERKDKFKDETPTFDLTQMQAPKLLSLCYEWNGKRKPAFGDFRYQKDAIEYVSNEAIPRYNDIVEYNEPTINPAFVGKNKKMFAFGASRWRRDGIEKDVIGAYAWFPNFTNTSETYWHAILMAQHTAMLPRLIIWDTERGLDPAFARDYVRPVGYSDFYDEDFTSEGLVYNYPYFVDADFNTEYPNLYEFHAIDDSRLTTNKNLRFDAEFTYECNQLPLLDVFMTVNTPQGIGIVEEYEIKFATKSLKLSGTI